APGPERFRDRAASAAAAACRNHDCGKGGRGRLACHCRRALAACVAGCNPLCACPNFRQIFEPAMAMLPVPTKPKPIDIGSVRIDMPVVLAPMTGVTDMPFRRLVRRYGSGLNVTEMIASEAAIRETRQSIQKAAWDPAEEPVSMQLVGCDPQSMAEAAKLNEDRGAAIIDINFGCPVRKVVNGYAGSALMR